MNAQAADLGIVLGETRPGAPHTVIAGTNYTAAAEAIFDGLGLAHALPAVASTLPLDVTWPPDPESTWLSILDNLYAGINHRAPRPDVRGKFTTSEQVDPSTETPAITCRDDAEPRMIDARDPYRRKDDPGRHPNRCVVLIDDPRRPDLGFHERVNDDLTSSISTRNRATVIERIDSDSERSTRVILDAATAGKIAEYRLRAAAADASTARLSTFPDPRREPHETYTLAIAGIESSTLWRVRSWSRPLSVRGVMTQEVGRAATVQVSAP